MKKLMSLMITVLAIALCVTSAFAAQTQHHVKDITFSLDEDYTIYKDNSLAPASSVKGLLFMAVSSDNLHQIQARCTTTEFSKQLDTFSGLDDEMLKPVAQKIFDGEYEALKIGKYVYLKELVKTDDEYNAVYVTVSKGKLYTFTYFGTEPSRLDYFVTTVTIPLSTRESNIKTYIIILIAVFIIADLVFLAFLIRSFIRDYKRRKMEQSENIVSQYIKIKRRKY